MKKMIAVICLVSTGLTAMAAEPIVNGCSVEALQAVNTAAQTDGAEGVDAVSKRDRTGVETDAGLRFVYQYYPVTGGITNKNLV